MDVMLRYLHHLKLNCRYLEVASYVCEFCIQEIDTPIFKTLLNATFIENIARKHD